MDGWLGDRETLEIAAFDGFSGEVCEASWFPSMEVAQMWQVYVGERPSLGSRSPVDYEP